MYRSTVSNGRITGYVVEFADSDACGEFHGGTDRENKENAIEFDSVPAMIEALTMVVSAYRLAEASTPANLRRVITMVVKPLLARMDVEIESKNCNCGADRTGPSAEAHADTCPQG